MNSQQYNGLKVDFNLYRRQASIFLLHAIGDLGESQCMKIMGIERLDFRNQYQSAQDEAFKFLKPDIEEWREKNVAAAKESVAQMKDEKSA